MKVLGIIAFLFLVGCVNYPDNHIPCGELIPVRQDKYGRSTTFSEGVHLLVCDGGTFVPVPTGPWYECRCCPEEAKP